MDTSVAAVTLRVVDPDTDPTVALIVVEPMPTDVAMPLVLAPLLIDATDGVPDCHVAADVRFCVEPSV
jgi:hypothetical protein